MFKTESDIKIEIPKLSEYEKALKKAYLNGGSNFVENKMSYSEYRENVENGKCVTYKEDLYTEKSVDRRGYTVKPVGDDRDFKNIMSTIHSRYSYPVMHNHDYIEMIYVLSGKCVHFVEDRSFTMKKDDLCIMSPKSMHAISVADDDTVVINIMVNNEFFNNSFLKILRGGPILKEFFEGIFFQNRQGHDYVMYSLEGDSFISDCVKRTYFEVKNKGFGYQRMMEMFISELFIVLIRHYEMYAVVGSTTNREFNTNVVSILGYISRTFMNCSLTGTAEFFGYAPNYLSRMLKKYTGKTFQEIVEAHQMERARELLEEGDLSVTEIGQEIGCYDGSHFSRKFQKKYGLSPVQYRKTVAEGKTAIS